MWIRYTFLDGFDLGAGAAGGVDGFLVLLRGGAGSFLADDNGLPILAYGTDSCHFLSRSLSSLRRVSVGLYEWIRMG